MLDKIQNQSSMGLERLQFTKPPNLWRIGHCFKGLACLPNLWCEEEFCGPWLPKGLLWWRIGLENFYQEQMLHHSCHCSPNLCPTVSKDKGKVFSDHVTFPHLFVWSCLAQAGNHFLCVELSCECMQDTIFTPEHLITQHILTKINKSRAEQQNSQIIRMVKEQKGQICLSWLEIGDRISIPTVKEKSKRTANVRKTSWQQGTAGWGMSPRMYNRVLTAGKYIRRRGRAQCPRAILALQQRLCLALLALSTWRFYLHCMSQTGGQPTAVQMLNRCHLPPSGD